jgi:hypothetical protein
MCWPFPATLQVFSQPCTDSFIVLFKTPQAATLAASSAVFPQSSARPDGFQVQAAPSPEDVLWQVGVGWQCSGGE